jgi:pimeloyl-ACP methyl ester carboxylesterase
MSEGEDQIESDHARVFTPHSPSGVTALVLGGDVKLSLADLSLSERLAADGALVFARALSNEGEPLSDREATAMATEELSALIETEGVEPDAVVLAGVGRGGTLAVLCACRMDGAALVLDLGGPLIYKELDEGRSVQPLEMLLNLSAPLFMAFGEEVSDEERGWVESSLSQFARTYDIFTATVAGSELFKGAADIDEPVWEAAKAFLQLHLETS